MLTFIRELGMRCAEFSIEPLPEAQTAIVLATLRHYIGDIRQAALVPQPNEAKIKAALGEAVPQIKQQGEHLRQLLNQDYSVILLSRYWIDQYDLDTRAALLYAQSLFIGSPTPTDKVDHKVVWDVRALDNTKCTDHQPTFSEHSDEAKLHTDTQYYPTPERFMMLYSNRPAQCGGGSSSFRDINSIKQTLNQTEQGRQAIAILSQTSLPFRVPMSFTKDGKKGTKEFTYAPILADKPKIRYRQDTLNQGFKDHPHHQTEQTSQALDIFNTELSRTDAQTCLILQADAMLLMNNHECLHGRTAFSDQHRHSFRIRMAE
jgi:alpha-ketoglutarate-dependent taurine dioxygenase